MIVPGGGDQTVYLVAEDFGKLGRAWREADYDATDLETVIKDLLTGQYNNPIRVVAFNTDERWSEDVSEDVAHELGRRCDLQLRDLPSTIQDFVERHGGHPGGNYRFDWPEKIRISRVAAYAESMRKSAFKPCIPTRGTRVPNGPEWLHEVK